MPRLSPVVTKERPTELEVFSFLVTLRNSGATNMFGATPYIEAAYPALTKGEARNLLVAWIKSFSLPKDQQPDDGR